MSFGARSGDAICCDQLSCSVAHRPTVQEPSAGHEWWPIEIAEKKILGHRHPRYARIKKRFLGKAKKSVTPHLLSGRPIPLTAGKNGAVGWLSLARENLDELPLAVSGYAGNADNLA